MVSMNHGKYLVTARILLVPLLSAAQLVQSQQYSTTTITTLATGSQVSTMTLGTQTLTTIQGASTPVARGCHDTSYAWVCGIYFVQVFRLRMRF